MAWQILHDSVLLFRGHHLCSPSDSGTDEKGLKPIRVLVIYPCVAFCALLLMYFVQIPQICMVGGFLIGYFAAGGVLQLATSTANEMFPETRAKSQQLL